MDPEPLTKKGKIYYTLSLSPWEKARSRHKLPANPGIVAAYHARGEDVAVYITIGKNLRELNTTGWQSFLLSSANIQLLYKALDLPAETPDLESQLDLYRDRLRQDLLHLFSPQEEPIEP